MRAGIFAGCLTLGMAAIYWASKPWHPDPGTGVVMLNIDYAAESAPSPAFISESATHRFWRVPFVTSAQMGTDGFDQRLVVGRFTALSLGTCQVGVPCERPAGSCEVAPEEAHWEDPRWQSHIVRRDTRISTGEEFFDGLHTLVSRSQDRDVLLFVHGYNVTFHEAACRAAQLAQDMPFNGVVICFRWHSRGELKSYGQDEATSELSPWALASLLARLRRELPPESRLNVLAHSMGNRVLLGALEVLRGRIPDAPSTNIVLVQGAAFSDDFAAWRNAPPDQPPLHHVVFAAADVDQQSFRNTLQVVRPVMHDATLYASSYDLALWASSLANLGARAGDAKTLVLADGLITIDASRISHKDRLGHSYYGNSDAVLGDLFHLLKMDLTPNQRPWLTSRTSWRGRYWSLPDRPLERAQGTVHK